MADERDSAMTGILIDEETTFTLEEFARVCAVHVEYVVELVHEGVLEAEGEAPERWAFSGAALARARMAVRLRRDLELSTAGVALVLDLLDELARLRARRRDLSG